MTDMTLKPAFLLKLTTYPYENRGVFEKSLTDVEAKIQAEYEASLAVLRPIKEALSQTDMLIDKIVYRLYGLTDDEIELIERPLPFLRHHGHI